MKCGMREEFRNQFEIIKTIIRCWPIETESITHLIDTRRMCEREGMNNEKRDIGGETDRANNYI